MEQEVHIMDIDEDLSLYTEKDVDMDPDLNNDNYVETFVCIDIDVENHTHMETDGSAMTMKSPYDTNPCEQEAKCLGYGAKEIVPHQKRSPEKIAMKPRCLRQFRSNDMKDIFRMARGPMVERSIRKQGQIQETQSNRKQNTRFKARIRV